jgi:hypothetical protein
LTFTIPFLETITAEAHSLRWVGGLVAQTYNFTGPSHDGFAFSGFLTIRVMVD